MARQNPKSQIPSVSPVYFPFTFIAPSLLETLSVCFHRVVLYRPAGSTPLDTFEPWIAQGFLDVRMPFEEVVDTRMLTAELRKLRAWGLLHQDADLAYLKTVRNQIAPADPLTPKIVSEIKAAGDTFVDKVEHRDLSVQLFLHLAQDFDQQSWELREQLDQFRLQHQALHELFHMDREVSEDAAPPEPFVRVEEALGEFLVEKRMAAWNQLFQKDPAESPVLFTDSPSAHAWLIDHVQDKVEVLKFQIPCPQPPPPKPAWKDHLEEIFHTLLITPWSEQLQGGIGQATRQVRESIDSWKEPVTTPGQKMACVRWYVLPNHTPHSLLNHRCGLEIRSEAGPAVNTVTGLVECSTCR